MPAVVALSELFRSVSDMFVVSFDSAEDAKPPGNHDASDIGL